MFEKYTEGARKTILFAETKEVLHAAHEVSKSMVIANIGLNTCFLGCSVTSTDMGKAPTPRSILEACWLKLDSIKTLSMREFGMALLAPEERRK
jgi:hypothetical protein